MTPYLKYLVYAELKDENVFSLAGVQFGTMVWDEETDIDPDRLYLESKGV